MGQGIAKFRVLVNHPRTGTMNHVIEALNKNEAARQGRRHGTVLSVKKMWSFSIEERLSRADRFNLLTRLGAMQNSKVAASESLAIIAANYKGPIHRVASSMLKSIESGSDISQAMDRIGSPDFPRHTCALVRAGSKIGQTGEALVSAVNFEKTLHELQRAAYGGVWSGLVGFISAIIITFLSTAFLGPMVEDIGIFSMGTGEDINVDWAWTMALYVQIASGLVGLILVGLLVLSTLGRRILPDQADHLILKIPYFKDLVLAKKNYITLFGLSKLVGAGVPLDQALEVQISSTEEGAMKSDLVSARNAIRSGRAWAPKLTSLHPTDRAALSTSEDKDQISKALQSVSNQYQAIYAQRIALISPIFRILGMVFLTLAGVVMFCTTMLPMLMVTSQGF